MPRSYSLGHRQPITQNCSTLKSQKGAKFNQRLIKDSLDICVFILKPKTQMASYKFGEQQAIQPQDSLRFRIARKQFQLELLLLPDPTLHRVPKTCELP